MKQEDIIRVAQESGMVVIDDCFSLLTFLKRFAARIEEAEREEILDLVDAYAKNNVDLKDAIRARS